MERMSPSTRRSAPLIVLLLAVYAPLTLWAANITQAPGYAASRALVFNLALGVLALLAGWALTRSPVKGSLLAAFFLLLFITYGHFYDLIEGLSLAGLAVGRHRFLFPLWLALLAVGTLMILRAKKIAPTLIHTLLTVSGFLTLWALAQVGLQGLSGGWAALGILPRQPQPAQAAAAAAPGDAPDIYYILIDAYSRPDYLRENLNLDVSPFIDELKAIGFSVAECAASNYAHTWLAIPSVLNMEYLEPLGMKIEKQPKQSVFNQSSVYIKDNRLMQYLGERGYRSYTFDTVYPWLDIPDSTVFYSFDDAVPVMNRTTTLNFYHLYLRTTLLRPLVEMQEQSPEKFETRFPQLAGLIEPNPLEKNRSYQIYRSSLFMLEELPRIAAQPGPKFIYAHILAAHQPYVFNPDGSFHVPSTERETDEGYKDQIVYLNTRLPAMLRQIIANSPRPPVIILQSDHGFPPDDQKIKILDAFYLPGGDPGAVYPSISAVNTFRVVLDQYFNAGLGLLEDRSYRLISDSPHRLKTVENVCP